MPWLTTSEKEWGRGKNGPFYKGSDGNKQQETAGKRNNKLEGSFNFTNSQTAFPFFVHSFTFSHL